MVTYCVLCRGIYIICNMYINTIIISMFMYIRVIFRREDEL